MLKTKEHLLRLGIHAEISPEPEPDLSGYELVHVFNLMRPQDVYLQVVNAKRQGKPVAMSTIYGLYTEYDRTARGGVSQLLARVLAPTQTEYLKIAARAAKNREMHKGTVTLLLRGYRRVVRDILDRVDVFLPNSKAEMERVCRDFALDSRRFVVVPNAVDTNVFDPDKTSVPSERQRYSGCILCVARIEGRKSQLNLLRAAKDLPYWLLFIGRPAPNHKGYYEQLRAEANDRVVFVGDVPHASLPGFYKIAKVHALPSWMETPGLSSLEAGAMGCNLVVTEKGDCREYFGDLAYYCEPDSVESIRKALICAHNDPADPVLQQRIRTDFTWAKAAERTLRGYEMAMGHRLSSA